MIVNLPKNAYKATFLFNTMLDKPKCNAYDAII